MSNLFGWVKDDRAVERVMKGLPYPTFDMVHDAIRESGKGKTALLYKYIEKLTGKPLEPRTQAIGDCVSFGTATPIDCVKATEIVIKGDFEEWVAPTSTEDIYGGGRVLIGRGQFRGSDGSIGAWASEYVQKYGTLLKQKYDKYDLSNYSGNRASDWGDNGVPKELLEIARLHPIKTISQITSVEQARDAIANGYAINVCSNWGFSNRRDKDGFAAPEGSWAHSMSIIGIDDASVGISGGKARPGGLIMNSWGIWNGGPKRLDQPDGSFWVDYDVLNKMFREGDSWAYSDYVGFQPKELVLDLF